MIIQKTTIELTDNEIKEIYHALAATHKELIVKINLGGYKRDMKLCMRKSLVEETLKRFGALA